MRPRRLHALALLGLCLLVVAWAVGRPLPLALDAQVHDQITRGLSNPSAQAAGGDVVLIDIDEASLAQLGAWPWPRTLLADLVTRLRAQGARIQLWDIYLPEPASGDDALNAALRAPVAQGRAADVVLGQVPVVDPLVQSPPRVGQLRPDVTAPPGLCSAVPDVTGYFGITDNLPDARVGHLTATPDRDGGLRRVPAVICDGERRYPQLSLSAAALLEPTAPWVLRQGGYLSGPAQWLERGSLRFALDAGQHLIVPYRQPHSQWPAVSALQVLDGSASRVSLQDKVVVVGATAVGLVDTISTPFHGNAPGVSVHAELVAAALQGRWTVEPPWPGLPALVVTAALGLVLVLVWPLWSHPAALPLAGLLVALAPAALSVLARMADVIWPVAVPTAALLLFSLGLGALQLEAGRRQVRLLARHLESFLPRHLAQEIARQHPSGDSLGRPASGVVLALRVVGLERWSAAADSLKALGLVHAISSLAERHSRLHGGTLEHLQGDTLLLAWPTPQAPGEASSPQAEALPPAGLTKAVQQAVMAARSLQVELGALLGSMESERYPLGLRMALEAGPYLLAVAGSSSSRRSLMLGPAGDVSLALLPLCEELASPLLMGQRAAQAQPRVPLHAMGQFLLPDSGQPQTVFRVEP